MEFKLEDTHTFRFSTRRFDTGVRTDADSLPTAAVYEEDTDVAILTPTVVKPTGTGKYRVPIAMTAANGFQAGKVYTLEVTATVNTVTDQHEVSTFKIAARETDDLATPADIAADGAITRALEPLGTAMRGTDSALLAASAPSNFSALLINASGHVTRVTLCDGNADMRGTDGVDTAPMRGTDGVDTAPMRGTDNALLAASAPANWSNLGISVGGAISNVATCAVNTDMRGTDGVDTSPMRGTDGAATPGDEMALVDGAIQAIKFAADAISAAALSSDASNKVADHAIRRQLANVRASADGDAVDFRSALGAFAKLVNAVSVIGGTLTVMEENDSTPFGTQGVTTDAGAEPITAVDTN